MMGFKEIDEGFAANLMRRSLNASGGPARMVVILTPLEKIDLVEAVKARKKRAKLGDRWFTFRYEGKKVFYRCEGQFIPCGWIDIHRIESGDYLA